MKNKNRLITGILLFLIVFIIMAGMMNFAGIKLGTTSQIYRPVWGSIGCEETGATPNTPAKYFSYEGEISYLCIDTNCHISSIDLSKGCEIVDVFGNKVLDGFHDVILDINGQQQTSCLNMQNCYAKTASQGDVINLRGVCSIGKPYVGVAKAVFNYNEISLKKWQEGAPFSMTGDHCYTQSAKSYFGNLQPSLTDKQKTEIWKSTQDKSILGKVVEAIIGSDTNTKTNSEGKEYIPLGKYVPYIVKWEALEGLNANLWVYTPTGGNYAGENVLCDKATRRLYLLESVSTQSATYTIPTKELGTMECCINSDCLSSDLVCDVTGGTFTCKSSGEVKNKCFSDSECDDTWGRDASGKPYIRDGRCTSGYCQWTKKSVECLKKADCPYKAGYYAECSEDYKCIYTGENQKTACPYGSCCSGEGNYYTKDCSIGQTCCWSNNVIGECKVGGCGAQCQTDAECNDGNWNTKDYCQYGKCINEEQDRGNKTCEEKSKRTIFGFTYNDPINYAFCILEAGIKFTVNVIKFILASILAVISMLIFHKILSNKAKKKDRIAVLFIAIAVGLLILVIIWSVI